MYLFIFFLHPTTYSPHVTPYALRLTPHTLHPTRSTLHPAPYTLHPTPDISHPIPYTLHVVPFSLERGWLSARLSLHPLCLCLSLSTGHSKPSSSIASKSDVKGQRIIHMYISCPNSPSLPSRREELALPIPHLPPEGTSRQSWNSLPAGGLPWNDRSTLTPQSVQS